jgi:HPt (histidine-containing phosphotransfer) domain-containing protein
MKLAHAPMAEEPAVFDMEHFEHMTCSDRVLQLEIVEIFSAQAELWVHLLQPGAPAHSCRDCAHTIKGTARGIGLWALAAACEEAELVCWAVEADRARERVVAQLRERLADALAVLKAAYA